MTARQIKIGFALLAAQLLMLAMTMAFHADMDARAERAGLANIIEEAGK